MIKAVLFDFHNTLVENDRWFILEIKTIASDALKLLAEEGLAEYSEDMGARAEELYRELRLEVHESGKEIDAVEGIDRVLRQLGYTFPREQLLRIADRLQRECLPDARLCGGVHETIEALQIRGVRMGIVSSALYAPFLNWSLEKFGLDKRFTTIITSAGCGYYKSSPEIFLLAARELGVEPGDALHVGDSYRFDVLGAQRAGLKGVWLKLPTTKETQGPEADAVIDTLVQLVNYIDSQSQIRK